MALSSGLTERVGRGGGLVACDGACGPHEGHEDGQAHLRDEARDTKVRKIRDTNGCATLKLIKIVFASLVISYEYPAIYLCNGADPRRKQRRGATSTGPSRAASRSPAVVAVSAKADAGETVESA